MSGDESSVLADGVGDPVPGGDAEEILEVVSVQHRELAATFLARLLQAPGEEFTITSTE